jgi:hypothetical protein
MSHPFLDKEARGLKECSHKKDKIKIQEIKFNWNVVFSIPSFGEGIFHCY